MLAQIYVNHILIMLIISEETESSLEKKLKLNSIRIVWPKRSPQSKPFGFFWLKEVVPMLLPDLIS